MKAVWTSSGVLIAEPVEDAACLIRRMIGLMGRRFLAPGAAMFLSPCGSIHTFFMRFPLDVIFLDCDMRVVRTAANVRPWRMAFGGLRARHALEMNAGSIEAIGVKIGDTLEIVSGPHPGRRS